MSGHSKLLVNVNCHHWYIGLITGKAALQELEM